MKCQYCGANTHLPFKCPFCGGYFCIEHRLPETHMCQNFRRGSTEYRVHVVEDRIKPVAPIARKILVSPYRLLSSSEIIHIGLGILVVALVGVSTAITVVGSLDPLLTLMLTLIFTLAFVLHEFGHKFAARYYGLWAEFRLSLLGMVVTLISIFTPLIKIVSPGAVIALGIATRETIGKISLSGPLINILSSIVYFMLNFLGLGSSLMRIVYLYGVTINAYVALFNLLPASILDGYKIFQWNKYIWLITFITALVLIIIRFTL